MHVARGEGFAVARRSELAIDAEPRADVVVLDSIGELAQLYQLATVAFVGGSLVPTGGHNILEPAVYGRPDRVRSVDVELRRDRGSLFLANGCGRAGCRRVRAGACPLGPGRRPGSTRRLGAAARALVDANRGATERTLAVIGRLLPRPAVVRPFRRVH